MEPSKGEENPGATVDEMEFLLFKDEQTVNKQKYTEEAETLSDILPKDVSGFFEGYLVIRCFPLTVDTEDICDQLGLKRGDFSSVKVIEDSNIPKTKQAVLVHKGKDITYVQQVAERINNTTGLKAFCMHKFIKTLREMECRTLKYDPTFCQQVTVNVLNAGTGSETEVEKRLFSAFKKYGRITNLRVISRKNKEETAHALITYQYFSEAYAAVIAMDFTLLETNLILLKTNVGLEYETALLQKFKELSVKEKESSINFGNSS